MADDKTVHEYGVIFGKKPESKDLLAPRNFKELYSQRISSEEDLAYLKVKEEEFIAQGYTTASARVKFVGKLELDDTLELKVTKCWLRPSPEGILGCDFGI